MDSLENDIMIDYQQSLISEDEALERLQRLYPDEEEDALWGIIEDWNDEEEIEED